MWSCVTSLVRQFALVLWHVFWNVVAFAGWILPPFWDGKHYFWLGRHVWAPGVLWLGGAPPTFVGTDRVDWSKPHVIVANHQGNADIPLLFMLVPTPVRFLAKKTVGWIPILGWLLHLARFPFIDRADRRKGRESIGRVARRIVDEKMNVVVFPEGTRSPEGYMLPFKPGAFLLAIEAQVPIVPVAIEGSGVTLARASFFIFPHPLKATVGEPISTVGLTSKDRQALCEKAERQILDMLGWQRIGPRELERAREGERERRAEASRRVREAPQGAVARG